MEDSREEIAKTCRRYGVAWLDLFGSAAEGQGGGLDPEKSDLDFVASFAPRTPARLFDRYFGPKEDLEELLGCPVDLVMKGALAKPVLRRGCGREPRAPVCGLRTGIRKLTN